jgi:hypothetical protein
VTFGAGRAPPSSGGGRPGPDVTDMAPIVTRECAGLSSPAFPAYPGNAGWAGWSLITGRWYSGAGQADVSTYLLTASAGGLDSSALVRYY